MEQDRELELLRKIEALVMERERLREALMQIAALSDTIASDRLAMSGSYGSFDEPGSVQIAREALGL